MVNWRGFPTPSLGKHWFENPSIPRKIVLKRKQVSESEYRRYLDIMPNSKVSGFIIELEWMWVF